MGSLPAKVKDGLGGDQVPCLVLRKPLMYDYRAMDTGIMPTNVGILSHF